MLKASALYIVIIIALVIAIFSATLIASGLYYRLEWQKNARYEKLLNNLNSGISILLSSGYKSGTLQTLDLFANKTDSIVLEKKAWGIFDLCIVKAFQLNDTLKRSFLSAVVPADKVSLYVADEDRPLSVSGSTRITGDAILPKAGIRQAYVDGKPYTGNELIYGAIKISKRELPTLNQELLSSIEGELNRKGRNTGKPLPDSLSISFFKPVFHAQLSQNRSDLSAKTLSGRIVIYADTLVEISNDCILNNVIIYAPAIIIEEGFKGNCQLFARDSIVAGKNCSFSYPSCMGIIKPSGSKTQAKVELGSGSIFSGILFAYEQSRSDLQTMVSLGKDAKVMGEVYSSGYVKMDKPVEIIGKVSCTRFIIRTPATLYENYLIDIIINRVKRSNYYLSSRLFTGTTGNSRVLKWLN